MLVYFFVVLSVTLELYTGVRIANGGRKNVKPTVQRNNVILSGVE